MSCISLSSKIKFYERCFGRGYAKIPSHVWGLIFLLIIYFQGVVVNAQEAVGYIETPLGDIYVRLYDETPVHKASFIQLAEAGYWDTLTFNRVIPGFVAQGGCPDTEEGFSDPDYLLEPEFVDHLKHAYGALGAGRDDNPGKLSARCQFYIVHQKEGIPRLDGNYTVYGRVIKGMEVVDKIVNAPRDAKDEPLEPVWMKVSIQYLSKEQLDKLTLH